MYFVGNVEDGRLYLTGIVIDGEERQLGRGLVEATEKLAGHVFSEDYLEIDFKVGEGQEPKTYLIKQSYMREVLGHVECFEAPTEVKAELVAERVFSRSLYSPENLKLDDACVRILSGIEDSIRTEILKEGSVLFKRVASGREKAEIMKAFASISNPVARRWILEKGDFFLTYIRSGIEKAHVVAVLGNIKPDELDEFKDKSRSFLIDVLDDGTGFHYLGIIQALRKIPLSEFDEFKEKIAPFLNKIGEGYTLGSQEIKLIDCLASISDKRVREKILDKGMNLMTSVSTLHEMVLMINTLGTIADTERLEIILDKGGPFFNQIEDFSLKIAGMQAFLSIEDKMTFEEILNEGGDLFNGIKETSRIIQTINSLASIPHGKVREFKEKIVPFLARLKDPQEKSDVIDSFTKIPVDQIDEYIIRIESLCDMSDYINIKGLLKQDLLRLPLERLDVILIKIKPFLALVSDPSEKVKLFEIFIGMKNPEIREEILNKGLIFIRDMSEHHLGFDSILSIINILRILADIRNPEARASILDHGEALLECFESVEIRGHMIELVTHISPEKIEGYLRKIKPFIDGIDDSWIRLHIAHTLFSIQPQEDLEAVLNKGVVFIEEASPGSRLSIIKALAFIKNSDVRKWILDKGSACLEGCVNDQDRAEILSELGNISLDRIEAVSQYFNSFETVDQKIMFLKSIELIPLTLHEGLASYIISLDQPIAILDIISNLSEDPEFREQIHQYLIEKLQSPNREEAGALSDFLVRNRNELGLAEESSLFQEAVAIYILTHDLSGEKNPYKIYTNLLQESKEPLPEIEVPKELIGEKSFSINPKALQQHMPIKLKGSDLPRGVTKDTLSSFFSHLEGRIALAPRVSAEVAPTISAVDRADPFKRAMWEEEMRIFNEKNLIKREILRTTQESFEALKENFLEDSFIRSLVNQTYSSEQEIPKSCAMFCQILKYISDLSDEVAEGEILSAREEVLLKISASIRNCPTGKAEGVIIAYNSLPARYKYTSEREELDLEKQAKDFVQGVIREFAEALSDDSPMVKEMIGIDGTIEQLSHQSTYIKNRLYRILGLDHDLKFDMYTGVLYDSLLARSSKDLAEIFFKYLLPHELIEAVEKKLCTNQDGERNNIYAGVNQMLERCGIRNPEVRCWEVTDYYKVAKRGEEYVSVEEAEAHPEGVTWEMIDDQRFSQLNINYESMNSVARIKSLYVPIFLRSVGYLVENS